MFKRGLFLFVIIAMSLTVVYPNSRVIISGKSSLSIGSQNNQTNIIASDIETISGGEFTTVVLQDSQLSNNFEEEMPSEFTIGKAYPNPFNPTTTIRYSISTTTPVDVVIYDMRGRLVSDHKIEQHEPGWHEFTWQGINSNGQQVSTGMYLVTMRAGENIQKQKVTLLK